MSQQSVSTDCVTAVVKQVVGTLKTIWTVKSNLSYRKPSVTWYHVIHLSRRMILGDALLHALGRILCGSRSVMASKLTPLYFTNQLDLVQFLIDQQNHEELPPYDSLLLAYLCLLATFHKNLSAGFHETLKKRNGTKTISTSSKVTVLRLQDEKLIIFWKFCIFGLCDDNSKMKLISSKEKCYGQYSGMCE